MSQKNIEIIVNLDGTTVVEANNFKGVGCKDASKQIELALAGPGGSVSTKPKDDFYQTNATDQFQCR
jgi:Protein of unknown function (DUF2997).